MWFDSHCHLYELEETEPLEDVVARARDDGVEGMLVLGTDLESSRRAVRLSELDGVWAGAGIHPNSSSGWRDDWAGGVRMLLEHERVVAVGESGLDFYRDHSPREHQLRAFAAHIELAKETGKALVIHTRESVDETMDALEDEGPPARLVFHCWSGTESQMARALSIGAHISFAGNISFKSAAPLRTLAALVPEDRLLVETDSPYLAPEPRRGSRNEPANVTLVGAAVAEARGVPSETVARQSTRNARRLLGIEQ